MRQGVRKTYSRFEHEDLKGKVARLPPYDHPALTEKRTIYPSTVIRDVKENRVLKSGENAGKIGGKILKGKWAGFPVFTLTLEERATCPTTCRHWRSCFGNHMQWAERHAHGPDLEWRLEREVAQQSQFNPRGFAVRLHVLGDFYSVEYVKLWRRLLKEYPPLHAFGFSARWDDRDPIAAELICLVRDEWERFAIRFSNAPVDECATVSIECPIQKPEDATICPQQTGSTESCSTCALCWQSKKRIAFLQH